jgi:hypothetical protein
MNKVTVQSIIEAAREDGKEFTQSQAQRILDRHKQLVKEGQALRRNKRSQINDAWRSFDEQDEAN